MSLSIDFLESLGYRKFGVTGHCLGGSVAIAAASTDGRMINLTADWLRKWLL